MEINNFGSLEGLQSISCQLMSLTLHTYNTSAPNSLEFMAYGGQDQAKYQPVFPVPVVRINQWSYRERREKPQRVRNNDSL